MPKQYFVNYFTIFFKTVVIYYFSFKIFNFMLIFEFVIIYH